MTFDAFSAAPTTPSTTSPTAQVDATPPSQPASTPDAGSTSSEPASASPAGAVHGATTEPVEFAPNFKFKVMDKEHEIPEMYRGLMKDADAEKQVREIFEKAYGLDVVKLRMKEYQEKYKTVNDAHSAVMAGIGELRESVSRNDFDAFFDRLKIPQEKILQWILDKAKYNELPAEHRQALEAKKTAENRALLLEKQNQEFEQQIIERTTQAKAQSLQFELEKPEIRNISAAFDTRAGKPGAFRNAVIDAGELAWIREKIDLTPEQAVQRVLEYWGHPTQQAQPPLIPPPGTTAPQSPQVPTQQKTPSIPNVAGRSASSVSKPKPKSIDDLKKLAAQMAG